ncbi:MAG: TolB family protein [Flammeovirgaceae bacterium]
MKNFVVLVIATCFSLSAFAQSATEVYLFDFKKKGKNFQVTNPINISTNKGYDNQPSFLPDGSAILFTSTYGDQTDVVRYDIKSKTKTKLTNTAGSEYSPTVMPNGTHFSSILLEKDGRQLLWKYPLAGGKGQIVVEKLVIGYHCWFNENTLFSFVLGDQFTLQKTTLSTGKHEIVAKNIGRSLHKIPKTDAISYIQKDKIRRWSIQKLDPATGNVETLIKTHRQQEDMAWTPKGTILMGKGEILYKFNPKKDDGWVEVISLKQFGLTGITRLAVSPKGDKLVVVVAEK